jgi:hypothetical protein
LPGPALRPRQRQAGRGHHHTAWKDPENGELYVWVVINQVDLDRMAGDVHGKVIRKQLKDAGEEHRDTIKKTFDEEFNKQFSN